MKNPFKALFSMPELVTAAIKGGDALVFTQEEKMHWVVESAKVLGPQTLARRVIAIIVTVLWALLTVIMAGMILGSHENITAMADLYTKISLVFGGVMTFYFGAAVLRARK